MMSPVNGPLEMKVKIMAAARASSRRISRLPSCDVRDTISMTAGMRRPDRAAGRGAEDQVAVVLNGDVSP